MAMQKAIDLSKFRQSITKSITGISAGFNDPIYWISTGNYCLNYLISGNFFKGIPYGKMSMFGGESGSGKSFLVSGNLARTAQEDGAFVVLLDTENALDEAWLKALGVNTDEDKLLRLGVTMIDDIAKIIGNFIEEYQDKYTGIPIEEKPKVLFVVDSLGMALTPTDVNQFEAADLKGDLGRKAKMLTALVRNLVNRIANTNIAIVATNHSYQSGDQYAPDDIISGGRGFVFASSIVVLTKKLKLKEDDEGNKISDVTGIRASCKVLKTRYSKPFESVEIKIPYLSGMDPLSGLFDLFEKCGKFQKVGNRYKYVTKDGKEMLHFRKEWNNADKMAIVMKDFTMDDLQSEAEFEIKEEGETVE
jgi:recombination protein RecA